jgi:hypothetical protein
MIREVFGLGVASDAGACNPLAGVTGQSVAHADPCAGARDTANTFDEVVHRSGRWPTRSRRKGHPA